MSSSESESESESNLKSNEINLYDINNSIKATYLLHKCQLNIEIKKLKRMIEDTEKQKEVVEILKKTADMLKDSIKKE